MHADIPRLTTGDQIGDYLLTDLLNDGDHTRTWKAHQASVNREVIVESLNIDHQSNEENVQQFLNDVRAKASIDHPLIGSVYEAVREGRHCFYAREILSGTHLGTLLDQESTLSPEKVAHILLQLAEAQLYLEEHGIATEPLLPEHIILTEHHPIRIANTSINAERDPNSATLDKHNIAHVLDKLLEPNRPGSTRSHSLLQFMADLDRPIPLTWMQIHQLAGEILEHLASAQQTTQLHTQPMLTPKRKKMLLGGISAAVLATAITGVGYWISQRPKHLKARQLTAEACIPAGTYTSYDGSQTTLDAFSIDAHEVTIAEYSEFLDALALLSTDAIKVYQHREQPARKSNHLPDDWTQLSAAATTGSTWNGLPISPDHPIVGVDWWDAYAYSQFRHRHLPTDQQWQATLQHELNNQQKLTASPWGPVDQASDDITTQKIHGLAGNVSEWSADMSKDPASPTQPKMPLILGGSYRKPQSNAQTHEWLSSQQLGIEDARNLRRSDLGFRTLSKKHATQ